MVIGIPIAIAGKKANIQTDVVQSDIPMLMSKTAMKQAKVKLDLEHDTAEILGEQINLNHTSSGHYCVPIDGKDVFDVENVCVVKLHQASEEDHAKALTKLHRQFAYPPQRKLTALLKDVGQWDEGQKSVLDDIYKRYQLCQVYTQTPRRPAVTLPMAAEFNEKVAMDLKKWDERWILHMVDMWSCFTVSVFRDHVTSLTRS